MSPFLWLFLASLHASRQREGFINTAARFVNITALDIDSGVKSDIIGWLQNVIGIFLGAFISSCSVRLPEKTSFSCMLCWQFITVHPLKLTFHASSWHLCQGADNVMLSVQEQHALAPVTDTCLPCLPSTCQVDAHSPRAPLSPRSASC